MKRDSRCGHLKSNGQRCKLTAGHDTIHPGKGRCIYHEDPAIVKRHCYAKKNGGGRCSLPAGLRTSHLGTGRCYHHEYPNDNSIPHKSKKLTGEVCTCKSRYEKHAFEKLDSDHNVVSYTYEPYEIPYQYEGQKHTYISDVLVEYSNGGKALIEIKNIVEMLSPLPREINYAKFKAANIFARVHKIEFQIWACDYFKKEVFSFDGFCVATGQRAY